MMLEKRIDIKSTGYTAVVEVEKRKMKRFDLELKACLSSENQRPFECLTSNISAGGAFLKTQYPLSVGTDVNLNIVLPLNKFKNERFKRSIINVSGSVIRIDLQGMAICFDKKYQILPH